jgi:molybdate transport system regulatory protein
MEYACALDTKVVKACKETATWHATGPIGNMLPIGIGRFIFRGVPLTSSPGAFVKRAARGPDLACRLQPRHKVWLVWDGVFLMGPNYQKFLAAIDETGTIRDAGKVVGWSYRTCLNRIRRMEAVLGAPVLSTTRGGRAHGGSQLTPLARRLLRVFEAWRTGMLRRSDAAFVRALK